ncbi:MAG: MFS transporter [Phycisphaerales bacterium JB063]
MQTADAQPAQDTRRAVLRWGAFFALAYAIQGFAQTVTLFNQPISFYYKTAHDYDAGQLAEVMFFLGIPWYLKPAYGLLSDFVPLFGTRRKSYLILLSLLSTVAFGLLLGVRDPKLMFRLLMLTTIGTAMSDVMVDGLMVEQGQRSGRVKLYQGLQWVAIYATSIGAAYAGGALSQAAENVGEPIRAIQWAAMLAIAGPAVLVVVTWWLVDEPRHRFNGQSFRETLWGINRAARSRPLWLAALFLCCFWFQPGMNAPMYVYATGDTLNISEAFWGKAAAIGTFGYLLGALIFLVGLGPYLSIKKLALIGVTLYSAATLGYLFLQGPKTLVVLGFCLATANAIANLMLLSLAAQVCPKRVEAFVFAALMSLMNLSRYGSEWIGGRLYEGLLEGQIQPLIVISAVVTMLTGLLIPLLPDSNRRGD